MKSRGHSIDCANAVVTTPDECECLCKGAFHGGPGTARARALVWPAEDRAKYSHRQVVDAKRKTRQSPGRKAVGDVVGIAIVDTLIGRPMGEEELARSFMSRVTETFTEAIVTAYTDEASHLTPRQRVALRREVESAVSEEHLLCSICVDILQLETQLESLLTELAQARSALQETQGAQAGAASQTVASSQRAIQGLVGEICDAALGSSAPSCDDIAKAVIRAGLHAVATLLSHEHLGKVKRFIQLVGVVTCPEIDEHPEVVKLCLAPLLILWPLPPLLDWVNHNFSLQDPFLRTPPRRPRTSRS